MTQCAKVCFRAARGALALMVGLAMFFAPAALSDTSTATTGTAGAAGGKTDVSSLRVCGSPAAASAASATSEPASAAPEAKRAARRTGAGSRTARGGAATGAGGADPASAQPVQGTLTLDQEDQETVTAAAFGRSTDPQPLTLVYRVAGCRVTDALAWPVDPLFTGPVKTAGARMLPRGAIRIDDVDAEGDRYVVHLRVFASSDDVPDTDNAAAPGSGTTTPPATTMTSGTTTTAAANTNPPVADGTGKPPPTPSPKFGVKPGSYTSFVRLKANWMRTVATPVTVTRSENRAWVPIGVGMLGSGCGFFLFWLARKIHHDSLLVTQRSVFLSAGVASVVIGAGSAFFTNYLNQDVWSFSANGIALFIAAFSASTAGVAAGLLTGIYKSKDPA